MSSWLVWSDLFVVGLGADIAAAVMLAFSFAAKRPRQLADELVLVTRTYSRLQIGLAAFARSLARQKAESHVGLLFLACGFGAQLVGHLWPHSSGLSTQAERFAAVGLVGGQWVLAFVIWRAYVPWRTERELATAATDGDALLAADAESSEEN